MKTFSYVPSRSFTVLHFTLMFKCAIHLKFIYVVWGMFIFFHIDIWLFQHHLLKSLTFFQWITLAFLFLKNQLTMYVEACFWTFYSVPLIYKYDSAIPLLGIYPPKLKGMSTTALYVNVHGNLIHNSPKLEITQMPIDRWMDKQIMIYPCNGIAVSN